MNKKGESEVGFGMLIVVFMAIIVGVVFFQVIAQEVGRSTNTIALENQSLVIAAVNDTPYVITNCRAISGAVFFNETGDVPIAGTATIVNNVVTNGALTVTVTPDVAPAEQNIWTVDATCQPLTYIAESGGRAVAGLIVIFFALAVAVVSLTPTLRSRVLESFGR